MALWNVDLDVYWQGMYSNGDPARMVVVLEAACAGVDLETGPFPVKAIPLEAALAEMEALRTEVLSDRLWYSQRKLDHVATAWRLKIAQS